MINEAKLVTLPKEVASAINGLKDEGYPDYVILMKGASRELTRNILNEIVLFDWVHEDMTRMDDLMSALVNGYQVEASPEQKVRDYISKVESFLNEASSTGYYEYCRGKRTGAKETLDLLGIKIEGVNA